MYRETLFSLFVFLAQPLPDPPSHRETTAYQPVVIQQHLSLWDSLHFTDKVSYACTESGTEIINITHVALLIRESGGRCQSYSNNTWNILCISNSSKPIRQTQREFAASFVDVQPAVVCLLL